jgi:hypothetical protein
MELHAVNRIFYVAYAHDFAVLNRFSSDFETVRDGFAFTSKRMVPCRGQRIADSLEDCFLVMFYCTGLSMHEFFGVNDFTTVCMNDSLVPKTNTQGRYGWAQRLKDCFADAKELVILWVTRTWRNHNSVRLHFSGFQEGNLVVSINHGFCSKFTYVLYEIVDERIIVVDD